MTLVRHENDNVSFPSQTWSSFPQMYPIERETAEIRHTTSSLCECTIHRRKEFVNHTMCSWLIIIGTRSTKSMKAMNQAIKFAYLNYVSV